MFEDINVGDRVKLETKTGDIHEITVICKGRAFIGTGKHTFYIPDVKSIIETKYQLPTEPGIYVIPGRDYRETLTNRHALLDPNGCWVENDSVSMGSEFAETAIMNKWNLKKIF